MAQAKIPPTANNSKKKHIPDDKIRWINSNNKSNEIIFSDGTIMTGVPDSIKDESDPLGKVLLCALAEIMIIRDRLENIEKHFREPPRPEFALGAPVKELKSEAVAFREKVIKESEK
jgi:hypothetical protein